MTRSIRFNRLLVTGVIAAAAAVPVAQSVEARPKGPDVPSEIDVEDGHEVYLVGHAVGVQIYACNATASGHAWSFVAHAPTRTESTASSSWPTSPARPGRRRTAAQSSPSETTG